MSVKTGGRWLFRRPASRVSSPQPLLSHTPTMKRLHEGDVDEKENVWASLCGDMVRALVHAEPTLLPALYLVNKGFHAALDTDNPNAAYWERYFNAKPGYSVYALGHENVTTWKELLKIRHKLTPRYYIKIANPCWQCGCLVPASSDDAMYTACACGQEHSTWEKITQWEPRLIQLDKMPVLYAGQNANLFISTEEHHPHIGCNVGQYSQYIFTFNHQLQQILRVEYTVNGSKGSRDEIAAALPGDIPRRDAWRIAQFRGFF